MLKRGEVDPHADMVPGGEPVSTFPMRLCLACSTGLLGEDEWPIAQRWRGPQLPPPPPHRDDDLITRRDLDLMLRLTLSVLPTVCVETAQVDQLAASLRSVQAGVSQLQALVEQRASTSKSL